MGPQAHSVRHPICVAALNGKNVEAVANAIAAV